MREILNKAAALILCAVLLAGCVKPAEKDVPAVGTTAETEENISSSIPDSEATLHTEITADDKSEAGETSLTSSDILSDSSETTVSSETESESEQTVKNKEPIKEETNESKKEPEDNCFESLRFGYTPESETEVAFELDSSFMFDSFREVVKTSEEDSIVFSPLSYYYALGMLSAGAKSETADELAAAMGLDVNEAAMSLKALTESLEAIEKAEKTKLNIQNSVFFANRLNISSGDAFGKLEYYYNAEAFKGELDTDTARQFINKRVSDATDGMIPEALSENLSPDVIMALVNTLFLDAEWQNPFENYGQDNIMEFITSDGETVNVKALSDTRYINNIYTDEAVGAIIDYSDDRLKFAAIMPKGCDIGSFINGLDVEKFSEFISSAEEGMCRIKMPCFSDESYIDLVDITKFMGINKIFDVNSADLSGFGTSPNGNIYLSDIFQKVRIDVDEQGTKAAAVTIALPSDGCPPTEIHDIILDHSFFYAVYDSETGIPLFMGVMGDPR